MMFVLSNYINPDLIKVDGSLCNASFFIFNNELMLLGRKVNYSIIKNDKSIILWPQWYYENKYTDEVIYKIKNDCAEFYKLLSTPSNEDRHKFNMSGDEDFRLMNWNNSLYASYTKVYVMADEIANGIVNTPIHICKINENLEIVNDKKVTTTQNVEKNWQPIEDKPFEYVYSYDPFVIIDLNLKKKKKIDNNKFDKNYFGSSQIIKYKDNYIGIIHYKNTETWNYYHYFVMFDDNMNLIKMSKPFKFIGAGVEFCTYIGIIENKLTVLASVHDQLTYRFDLDDFIIEDILNNKLENSEIKENLYDDLYYDALKNSNYLAAMTLSTFTHNKDILVESLKMTRQYNSSVNAKFFLQNKIIENL